ncbi:MAG: beta-L-arabinofuranosidase domain-containing protein [Atopobiaceae bacterium]|jgi:DUF1680 family protein
MANAAELDAEQLYIANLNTVEFDLDLPDVGANGSHITWESANERFLHSNGAVTQPKYGMGPRDVKLTATFTCPDGSVKKTYNVHVIEAKNDIVVKHVNTATATAELNTPCYLPSVVIVDTEDGRCVSHPVKWDGGLEQTFTELGEKTVLGHVAGTAYPAEAKVKVVSHFEPQLAPTDLAVESFTAGSVRLDPGSEMFDQQQRSLAFLLGVNDDQMLYNFRATAGLDTKGAPQMIGWDAPECLLRGHTTGHYLSALARCYSATGDTRIAEKACYLVASLAECQQAFEQVPDTHAGYLMGFPELQFDRLERLIRYPEVWAPYYTFHKVLAGLLDCFDAFGNKQALEVAEGMGDWAHARLSRLSNEALVTMWGIYIAGEFGGMNDALARLYERTGKQAYLDTARLFDNDKLFVPMEQGADTLEDVHANQHIPQVIGALRLFEETGEQRYLQIARNFWDIVVGAHIYVIGGTGESEMWHHPGRIAHQLSEHTAESCCSYNMVKLTRGLYQHDHKPEMLDYYERTLINHVLSSGDKHAHGARTYFMPLAPGFHKEFDEENTCCHGTGLEDDFMYADGIYYHTEDAIELAMFVPSHVDWAERGVALTQSVKQGKDGLAVALSVTGADSHFCLRVRKPLWATPQGFALNGKAVNASVSADGRWFEIEKTWQSGDTLEFFLPCSLRLEEAPDDKNKVVACWGPYVLAFLTKSDDFVRLGADDRPLDVLLAQDGDGPSFRFAGTDTEVRPLCMLDDEFYQVYVER